MKNLLPIILIILGLGLGYAGFNKLDNSSASLEIGGLEISAGDKQSSTTAYVMMGFGVICLIGGISVASRK